MAGSVSEKVKLDPSDLTIGELEDLEEVLGKSSGQIFRDFETQDFTAKQLRAFVWVLKRREEPGLTFEAARDLKMNILFSTNGDSANPPA